MEGKEGRFLLPGIRDFNEGGKGEKGGQQRRLLDLFDRFNYGIFPCTTKTSSKKIGITWGTLLHTHRKQKRLFCSAIVLHLVKHPSSLFFSPSRLLLFSRILSASSSSHSRKKEGLLCIMTAWAGSVSHTLS